MATDPTTEPLKAAKHSAFLNGKYHADREAFFDLYDKSITFGVLLTGAVAFLDAFGPAFQKFGAGFLGVFALLQLVAELPRKARDHGFLKKQYFEIASELATGSLTPTAAESEMLKLAGEERPIYCALHAIAENWATRAVYGETVQLTCKLNTWQRITRNWLRHEDANFGTNVQL